MIPIETMVQVRTESIGALRLIGFQGEHLDDQHELFERLELNITDITSKKNNYSYLVILPGLKPLVAIEAHSIREVPAGMTACTIPADDYVVFRLEMKHLGHFWNTICTQENQLKYHIDLSKPRFELFGNQLLPKGITEWYIPANR